MDSFTALQISFQLGYTQRMARGVGPAVTEPTLRTALDAGVSLWAECIQTYRKISLRYIFTHRGDSAHFIGFYWLH
jgi:hypothetical protein